MASYVHLLEAAVPKAYALRLVFKDCAAGAAFGGVLELELELLRPAKAIELHAKDIAVTGASARDGSGAEVQMTKAVVKEETETVELQFPTELTGTVKLSCQYQGKVRKALSGVYHCSFEGGVAGVSTHFEPVYARYSMPCIDEPKAKATFQLTIVAPTALTVVSNMPEERAAPAPGDGEGLTEHVFGATPRMSTYLVGFSVGDFGAIELAEGAAPVKMSLYAQRGQEKLGTFALDIAARSLAFFEDFFHQKFPLPKLDLVVPPDFPIGGMENWGIITLTNRSLIDDDASLLKRQRIAKLVSHEVSHMWFGDLVTPCWWDDLWLKEGFASWVNLLPLDRDFPGWRIWDDWALNLLYSSEGALEVDQYLATHAVEVPVNHPSQVQEIFDALSYFKGSAMVNMLFHSLGSDAFRKGLSAWLEKYKNSNSTTKDLWACLAEASGKPVEGMMATWTRQEGFPLLTVARGASGEYEIQQQRFTLRAATGGDEAEAKRQKTGLWTVPLALRRAGRPAAEQLLLEGPTAAAGAGDWLLLNAGVNTMLRVHHSPELLRALAREASRPESCLTALDRVALISDGFATLRAGLHQPETVLELIRDLLSVERDAVVWCGAVEVLLLMVKVLGDDAPSLRPFIANRVKPQRVRLGWAAVPGEPDHDALLRPAVLALLGRCGDEEVCREAVQCCEAYLCESHAPPPPAATKVSMKEAWKSCCATCGGLDKPEAGVRGVALRTALAREPRLWPALAARQARATANEERDQLLVALMGHQDRAVVEQWVADGLAGKLPSQEWGTLFAGLAGNRHHKGLAWDLLVRHWDPVYDAWGQSQFRMKAIVSSAMSTCKEPSAAEAFFKTHRCDVAKLTISQQLESMAANAALRARAGDVEKFLAPPAAGS